MWDKFTARARQAVFSAQQEAQRMGHGYVSTEHLLLGVLYENDTVASRIVERLGLSPGVVRMEVERQIEYQKGSTGVVSEMQLTPRGKRAIDLAYEEAQRLDNKYLGTEHLLLGLIREGDGLSGRVLSRLGITLEAARKETEKMQDTDSAATPAPSQDEIDPWKKNFPSEDGDFTIETHHILRHDTHGLRGKSLLSIADLTREQLLGILVVTRGMAVAHHRMAAAHRWQYPRALAMIFEKPSLRTRVSFELGMQQLGGITVNLGPADIGLGVRESVADVAHNLERMADAIMARVFKHEILEELRAHSRIPIINGLSDREHPCQTLADLYTLQQKKGTLEGLRLAYIGDGNNVLHSLLLGCALSGVSLAAACPKGYEPLPEIVDKARELAGGKPEVVITQDTAVAVDGADAVYTDVWTSMGQEQEQLARIQAFRSYQVNAALMAKAKPDAIFMHCLPAHRGDEVTDEVVDGPQSVVFDQAENRMHAQKAVLALTIGM